MAARSPSKHHAPSREVIDRYSSIPWCNALLNDASLTAFASDARNVKSTTLDSFVAITLNTPGAITEWQNFYRPPTSEAPFGELYGIIELGNQVCGWADTAHGGLIGLLLDEQLGWAMMTIEAVPGMLGMTASLNIRYKNPMPAPTLVLARSKLLKREGRKLLVTGSLEDGKGKIYATAEALFVEVKTITPRL